MKSRMVQLCSASQSSKDRHQIWLLQETRKFFLHLLRCSYFFHGSKVFLKKKDRKRKSKEWQLSSLFCTLSFLLRRWDLVLLACVLLVVSLLSKQVTANRIQHLEGPQVLVCQLRRNTNQLSSLCQARDQKSWAPWMICENSFHIFCFCPSSASIYLHTLQTGNRNKC